MKNLKNQQALILDLLKSSLPPSSTFSLLLLQDLGTALLWEKEKIAFIALSGQLPSKLLCKAVLHKNIKFVWLLDGEVFNQKIACQGEQELRSGRCYFFLRSPDGKKLVIYDQKEAIENNRRRYLSGPLEVDLSQPFFERDLFYFKGDVIHRTEHSLYFRLATKQQEPKTKKILTALCKKEALQRVFLFMYKTFVKKIQG